MPSFQVNTRWATMSEVVPGIYISGVSALKPVELEKEGITCIVNCTREVPNLNRLAADVDRIKLWLDDTEETDISAHLQVICDQMEMVRQGGGRCLVHCVAGVSRSAAFCLAYLVKYQGRSLREAYHYLSSKRPMVRPNLGFWRQLIAFEKELKFGRTSVRLIESMSDDGQTQTLPDLYLPMVVMPKRKSPPSSPEEVDKENENPSSGPLFEESRERRGSGGKPRFIPSLDSLPEVELEP